MNTVVDVSELELVKDWLGSGSLNIFGLPFAGKDTHARELAKLFDGVVIGGGDILRAQDKSSQVRQNIDVGRLAPTDDYIRIVLPHLSQDKFKDKPLILSSVGRWHGEEPAVLQATEDSGHPLKAVILLNITVDEVHRRWQASREIQDRGLRHDDAEHLLDTRIAEFTNKTLPVFDFYKQNKLLIEVDGMRSKAEVSAEILKHLVHFAKN